MRLLQILLATFLLSASSFAGSQAWQEIYTLDLLEQSRAGYERTTSNILTRLIEPILSTEEKRLLQGKLVVKFPRYSEQRHPTPLDFYAPFTHVAEPIFSLKFLDDLCTSYTWLQVNTYSLETVSEYTAPLLERSGPISPPLKAFQIPADALSDPKVKDLAEKHFASARTFILLHELGHLRYRHDGSSISNELEADRFAARLMADIPLQPLGMLVFFMADAHWSYAETTHPLSGKRVSALADYIEDSEIAQAFRDLGTCTNDSSDTCIDDPEIRSGFAATAKSQDESDLAPRRPHELRVLDHTGSFGDQGTLLPFQGKYVGESGQFGSPKYPTEVNFQRQGNTITGDYSFGIGTGKIVGKVTGNALTYEWSWAGNSGYGMLETQDEGQTFSGKWGYRNSLDNAGEWSGRRIR